MSADLEIRVEGRDELPVVHLDGRVDSTTAASFDEALNNVRLKNPLGVILACEDLRYISSAGLGVLLKVIRGLGQGRSLVMCGVSDKVCEILDIVGFSQFIKVTRDTKSASEIIIGGKT